MNESDWRLFNQKEYLQGEHLVKKQFIGTVQCDHVHCSFCWDKFGEEKGWLHIGYCTEDKRHWICENCFQDFKSQFEWIVENTGDTGDKGTVCVNPGDKGTVLLSPDSQSS